MSGCCLETKSNWILDTFLNHLGLSASVAIQWKGGEFALNPDQKSLSQVHSQWIKALNTWCKNQNKQ